MSQHQEEVLGLDENRGATQTPDNFEGGCRKRVLPDI